jgi:cobalt-precorrin 5A hydrolase / precorrin-3B C17-methyltransferase
LSHPAIIVIAPDELPLARRIAVATGGAVHGLSPRVCGGSETFKDLRSHLQRLFRDGTPIIAIMASGAVIRLLAPLLSDKHSEPPVVCVAADESTAVPLLGGHHGANDLARTIATAIGAFAAVTTAGDVKFGIALDEPPSGFRLANPEDAKSAMAALNAGAKARIVGNAPWLAASALPLSQTGEVLLRVSETTAETGQRTLHYHPRTLVLGMGCERGADPAEAIALADEVLAQHGLSPLSLAAIASIELKADEPAVHAVAGHFGVPCRFFTAAELEHEAPRLANPSEIVFAETGCHGVAEGAALALAGEKAVLAVPKTRSKRVTASIARAPQPVTTLAGRERGTLFVVGIGPGSEGWRSPEVTRMISQSTDLVGYSLYLDLVSAISEGKVRHDFDLGREEDRVRHAMELAGQGKCVALVCSGDAGIYAMATLVFELLEKGGLSDPARRIAIEVSPGISALQAAAARAGAPLGHDFCTISLSDLLTPWPDIVRRVRAAAEGDFVIAFYNPVSKRRRTQLAHSKEVLLQHRPADTPVILAANLGREGETVRVVPLAELDVDDVDMLTVVLVGSSQTRTVKTGDGRQWVYTPRGYAAKEGTGIVPSTTGERAAE